LPVEEIYLAPEDSQYEDILAPEDPQYEHISDALMKLPGEFTVTPCPAYMPTTRSAAPLEAEYEPAGGSVQGQGSLAPVGVGPDDSQQAHQRSDYENVSAPVDVVQLNPLAPVESGPHLYEDIDALAILPPVPEGSTGEFSVTPCPAYTPTTRSAAHLEAEYEDVSMPVEGLVQPGVGSGDGQQESAANVEPEYVIMNAIDNNEEPVVPICVRGQGSLARVRVGPDIGQEGSQSSGNVELDYEMMNALEDGRPEGIMESDQNRVSAGGVVQDHCSDNRQQEGHSSVYYENVSAPDEDEKPKDTTKSECEPVSLDYVIMNAADSDGKLEDTISPVRGGSIKGQGSLAPSNQQQENQGLANVEQDYEIMNAVVNIEETA
jgi:hypothetical protein